ncbi:hypothetical protein ACFSKN_04455 [Mariniflexile gromovii]|uniref:GlsB/YeaQ/YmgE family stress response membrane protein n=1 Tax=Mariniflexile gromovii TaxID=362523 RepID=A0ABS4BXW6_9FLAO|nr:hypothetical protein [Mariniflexile gromovii]MBP0904900.1 hypothetical protein [Mariniflexile gromovii]
MTETLLSLISIFTGIIAANLFGYLKEKYTFGFTGNTLIGVFGSALFIKTFGRLGFSPWSIANKGNFDGLLLIINLLVSALGGILLLIFIKNIFNKMNK